MMRTRARAAAERTAYARPPPGNRTFRSVAIDELIDALRPLLGAAGCRVRDARALHLAPAPRGPGAAWLGGDARGAVNFVVHATREA